MKSQWRDIHPGKIFRVNFDDIVDRMRYVADNYDECADFAMKQTPEIATFYDWDRLTSEAFTALESRIK